MFESKQHSLSFRPFILCTGLVSLLWMFMAWFAVDAYVSLQADKSFIETEKKTYNAIIELRSGMEKTFSILHAVPGIVSRVSEIRRMLHYANARQDKALTSSEARRTIYEKDPYFAPSSRFLAAAVNDLTAISALWVMTQDGITIAASNAGGKESFVGENFSRREYFHAAMMGKEGLQYGVGWTSHTAGLYFSAPVWDGDSIIGVVVAKIDIHYLDSIMKQTNAFLIDAYGVIIAASDPQYEMMVMPDAAIQSVSEENRMARYRQKSFDPLPISAWKDTVETPFVRIGTTENPFYILSAKFLDGQLKVMIAMEAPFLGSKNEDRSLIFAVLLVTGLLIILFSSSMIYQVKNAGLVKENKRHQDMLEHLAMHDVLTGVYRRGMTETIIENGIRTASETRSYFAVMFVDLDFFKDINDNYGHAAGDEILKETARRLQGAIRKSDNVIRYGGDEFIVILGNIESPDIAGHIASHILQSVRQPIMVNGEAMSLTASIGIAIYPDDGNAPEPLLLHADTALYYVKENGRAHYAFYDKSQPLGTKTQPIEN
ncbi:diguanylate cyclase [Oxalobacter vibrioformis]|uniref:Diguanylate cyclase n=1 Tax=Oxalobacter vibrioformis TaxID=933080 RepID=A0A9E9LY84_9BURK|nr:sensor domain-containing diguanylate cyclase [Oxalobacter vibrioformis]WAW09408.1 diguanylate cyclase [Oxalobacter vibrioformis]